MDLLQSLLETDASILQPLKLGGHIFPGIWQNMFPAELTQLKFPHERRSTCMNCPKSCYEGYRSDYRCCTYLPQVSNFLLGLASNAADGELALDRLLERGLLLPEGMHYTPKQWLSFLDDEQLDKFGRSDSVLCPLLDPSNGHCTIHAFRNAVCSTYFCYHDHGGAGESFWAQLQTLGSTLETALAQWSLEAAGFDLKQYFETFDRLAKDIHSVSAAHGWSQDALRQLWGAWHGREKELFRTCAALALQHREDLWMLANKQVIRESDAFDRAMVQTVPAQLESELDREEMGTFVGEILSPEVIWQSCLKAYSFIWERKAGYFALSSKVSFTLNGQITAEEQYHRSKKYFIDYRYQATDQAAAWRLAVTDIEKDFLQQFAGQRLLIGEALPKDLGAHTQDFVSEMISRKVLWPV